MSLDAEALNEVIKFVDTLIINNDYIGNDDQTESNSVLLKHFCIEFLLTFDQLLEISLILNESVPKARSLNLINFHNLMLLSKIECKDNTLFLNRQIFLELFLLIYKNNSF